MKTAFFILLIAFFTTHLQPVAFADNSGSSSNNEFGVKIKTKEEKFIGGFSGGVGNKPSHPAPINKPDTDIGAAVELIYFQ